MALDDSEMDFSISHIFKANLDVSCVGQKRDLSECSTTQPMAFPVQKKATKHCVTVNNLAKTAIRRWEGPKIYCLNCCLSYKWVFQKRQTEYLELKKQERAYGYPTNFHLCFSQRILVSDFGIRLICSCCTERKINKATYLAISKSSRLRFVASLLTKLQERKQNDT